MYIRIKMTMEYSYWGSFMRVEHYYSSDHYYDFDPPKLNINRMNILFVSIDSNHNTFYNDNQGHS